MGRVAEKQGDLEQAMAAYRAALTRDDRRADAYLRLAVLHDKQGKFRESAELYRKALVLRPGDPEIFCDMGYSYYLQRRWAESEMNLRQAIAKDPDHRRAHNNLALLLVCDNRLEDALAEFRKAGNSPAEAHMNLAFSLTMEQRWDPARTEYERALALDPTAEVAKDRLNQLNTILAKHQKHRGDGPTDSRVLTTSYDALPKPRPDVAMPAANQPIPAANRPIPAANQPDTASSPSPHDPRLVATAESFSSSRAYARTHVPIPSLPDEDPAMRNLWATFDMTRPSATALPPAKEGSHRQSGVNQSEGTSSDPGLAARASNPARSTSPSPRNALSPPRPTLESPTTTKKNQPRPASSISIPPPTRFATSLAKPAGPTQTSGLASPPKAAQINSDAGAPQTAPGP
jgi:hypothetical protein